MSDLSLLPPWYLPCGVLAPQVLDCQKVRKSQIKVVQRICKILIQCFRINTPWIQAVHTSCSWRTTKDINIIIWWECLSTLHLPDNWYISTLLLSELHTPAEESAVNTPTSDSSVICVITLKAISVAWHLRESTKNNQRQKHATVSFHDTREPQLCPLQPSWWRTWFSKELL